jgi:hypothetical protein
MRGVQAAANRAVAMAKACLFAQEPGSAIHDVQHDPRFQPRGVDLLWERSPTELVGVEVKGDRNGHRGNYFFELVSNLERDTPGCFLYSSADLFLYVFLDKAEVHTLPLAQTRAWFLERAKSFPVKHTRTRMGNATYTTLGAVVPVRAVLSQVIGATRFRASPIQG